MLRAAAEANSVPGVVAEVVFRGDYRDYLVAVGAEFVQARVYGAHQAFSPGERLHVVFPPEALFEVQP